MNFVIKPDGLFADLEDIDGKGIPTSIDELLKIRLAWVDPEDFSSVLYFYENGRLYAGCSTEVKRLLEEQGHSVRIDIPKESVDSLGMNKFLGSFRPLQKEAVDAALANRYGFIQAVPRFGKTIVAAAIAGILDKKTVFIVEDTAPFNQAVATFKKFVDGTVGEVKTANYTLGQHNIVMIQTWAAAMRKGDTRLLDALAESEVVIIDEAHHLAANSYISALHTLNKPEFILGISATPFSQSDREAWLYRVCGPVFYNVSFGQAIDHGLVVPLTVYAETMEPKNYGYANRGNNNNLNQRRKQYEKVKKDYIVNNDRRNRAIAEFVKSAISSGLSCAIVIDSPPHADQLRKFLPNAAVVVGATPLKKREQIWSKVENKEIMCVISTLIDEAINIPSLGAVALASGGKSKVKLLQRIRSITKFEGPTSIGFYKKTRGYLYYPIDKADFIQSHSTENLRNLKEFLSDHKSNVLFIDGKQAKI